MSDDKSKVVIEFDNPQAAAHFRSWLDGQGEQDYWIWMEYREQEEDGHITATHFDYLRDGSNRIVARCARLDKK